MNNRVSYFPHLTLDAGEGMPKLELPQIHSESHPKRFLNIQTCHISHTSWADSKSIQLKDKWIYINSFMSMPKYVSHDLREKKGVHQSHGYQRHLY